MWRPHGARHDAKRCEWAPDAEARACVDLAVLTPALGDPEGQVVMVGMWITPRLTYCILSDTGFFNDFNMILGEYLPSMALEKLMHSMSCGETFRDGGLKTPPTAQGLEDASRCRRKACLSSAPQGPLFGSRLEEPVPSSIVAPPNGALNPKQVFLDSLTFMSSRMLV